MPDMSGSMILKIVKGVARVPQDTQSAEIGLDEVDLLDPNGFALNEYLLRLPALKSSAVYADSSLTDGRTLISGAWGNVTETIRLTLNGSTVLQTSAALSRLLRFKLQCRDFWSTFSQIEPVYIKHQVVGEPGPRYALLYDIDVDIEFNLDPLENLQTVTLVIEREPFWRWLAPGDNPKHWSYIANDQAQNWNSTNAHLQSSVGGHLVSQSIYNRAEQNTTGTSWVTQNFVDIPAAKIPGDAPALLNLIVQQDDESVSATTLLVGKSTKPVSGNTGRPDGTEQLVVYSFNAGDGSVGTDTSLAADTGAPDAQSGSPFRSVTTFATPTLANRLTLPGSSASDTGFNQAVHRGRYLAFLRARVSAAATVSLNLFVNTQGIADATLPSVTLTDLGGGGTGNSTDWALLYLGEVVLPPNDRTAVSSDGRGLMVDSNSADFAFTIQASRSSGAGNLYISDLILIPYDEASVKIIAHAAVASPLAWMYDNTGYFTHGLPNEFAATISYSAATGNTGTLSAEWAGGGMFLNPKTNNRLYFLAYVDSTKRSIFSDPDTLGVRINIVPRSFGLRDA